MTCPGYFKPACRWSKRGGLRRARLLAALLTSISATAWSGSGSADPGFEPLPNVISLDTSRDASGGRDAYLDLDLRIHRGARFMATLGSSRFDGQDREVVTRTRIVGVRSDPLHTVGAGVEFEDWGEEGSVIIRSWRATLDVNTEHWYAAFRPQRREYTLYTQARCLRCPATATGRAGSVSLELGYYSDGPWGLSLGYTRHNYDFDVRRVVALLQVERVFSSATRDLASSFEDSRSSFSVSYGGASYLWSLTHIKSLSKVDGAETRFTTLRVSTDLNDHWRLNARLGRQRLSGTDQTAAFAGAGLAYSW